MREQFDIPLIVNGKQVDLPAELVPMGYVFKIRVWLEPDLPVLLERDEEGQFRAISDTGYADPGKNPDPVLLAELIAVLNSLMAD